LFSALCVWLNIDLAVFPTLRSCYSIIETEALSTCVLICYHALLTAAKTVRLFCWKHKECTSVCTSKFDPLTYFIWKTWSISNLFWPYIWQAAWQHIISALFLNSKKIMVFFHVCRGDHNINSIRQENNFQS
jgi:hypothetical protein